MRLSIAEIAEAAEGTPLFAEGDAASVDETGLGSSHTDWLSTVVSGATWDSRLVKPGDLYVALPGERVDGHDFVDAAASAGAACALVSRKVETAIPIVVVDDVENAFTKIAAFWRQRLSGVVIGLTGSVGKTSTKNLVRDVLSHARSTVATLANQNNEIGVPNTLLAADADTEAVVVEMGMRGLGQIAELCDFVRPDWGIVTNVGESHIELLGSRDNIARAKAELFEALPADRGIAFVNATDDYAVWMCEHAKLADRGVTVVSYGGKAADEAPSVWADDVVFDDEGRPSFNLNVRNIPAVLCVDGQPSVRLASACLDESLNKVPAESLTGGRPSTHAARLNGSIACKLELRGAHSVTNACAAAAVGLTAGMTLEQVRDALAAAQPEKGRQQVTRTQSGITIFDDSYNASPDSMQASLNTFTSMAVDGKRIAVLGDMLELGDFAQECHERVGVMAARAQVDRLVCVGQLSRHMARAAQEAGLDPSIISTCDSAEEALSLILPDLEPGDCVLAKASHSIGLDRIVKGLVS